jgi:hypothetical protein
LPLYLSKHASVANEAKDEAASGLQNPLYLSSGQQSRARAAIGDKLKLWLLLDRVVLSGPESRWLVSAYQNMPISSFGGIMMTASRKQHQSKPAGHGAFGCVASERHFKSASRIADPVAFDPVPVAGPLDRRNLGGICSGLWVVWSNTRRVWGIIAGPKPALPHHQSVAFWTFPDQPVTHKGPLLMAVGLAGRILWCVVGLIYIPPRRLSGVLKLWVGRLLF